MNFRALIVYVCYALSSVGILSSFFISVEGLKNASATDLIAAIFVVYAWVAHAVMSFAWVCDCKVSRAWVVSGTLVGSVCVLYLPVGILITSPIVKSFNVDLFGVVAGLPDLLWLLLFPVVMVLPCLLLAIYLVRFHWSRMASDS